MVSSVLPRDSEPAGRKQPSQHTSHRAPTIILPKGGGALKSIDEKFSVNAVNGTSALSIPLPFSRTRAGGPALALQYSSGSGNGPFALGWSIDLPSIQRRTDKLLPRYRDEDEGDVFLLSGVEDLVPALHRTATGEWAPDEERVGDVRIRRYRPRIEGAFSRIEQVRVDGQAACYWKVTSRDNVVTFYGLTDKGRIADPDAPERVFRWLPELSFDDTGNCIEYLYKQEDLDAVPDAIDECNRLRGLARFSNAYLKQIRYGNTTPYYRDPLRPWQPEAPVTDYLFDAVLDYGEHHASAPGIDDHELWPCRHDPFSDYRAGFEIRTYRLCRRILFFHTFAELSPQAGPVVPCLVRSLDLAYRHMTFAPDAARAGIETDLLESVRNTFYKHDLAGDLTKSMPAFSLDYEPLDWDLTLRAVAPEDVVNAPAGGSQGYQFVDLFGEGISGLLTEQANAWYYKHNLSEGRFSLASSVVPKPAFVGLASGALQVQDLDADGRKQVTTQLAGVAGYFELEDSGAWAPFRPYRSVATVALSDPHARLVDLDGDGRADLLIAEDELMRWYPSLGTEGHGAPQSWPKPRDEERGPAVVFADGTQTIFLADMNGDGLADIVRVRASDIAWWPNLGYGRFGAKVTMRDAPHLDTPDHFDPSAVRLFDVSGTGAADLVYLGRNGVVAWINFSGNAWSEAQPIAPYLGTESPNTVTVLDLLGNGTGCVVWSSGLPAHAAAPLRYIDLMHGRKPHILRGYANGMGATTRLEYRSSSHFYLQDKAEGHPWVTRLPFPTMCVSRHEHRDAHSGARFVHEYRYRHGYYDHAEREFRGFGMVEQRDTETFERFAASGASNVVDATLHQAPVRTRSWYHTGAFLDGPSLVRQFRADYFVNPVVPEHVLPDPPIDGVAPDLLTPMERREAARACKGTLLRQEVFADDGTPLQALPFSTAEHNARVRMVQPQSGQRHAVFLLHESEAITHHYERNPADPRVAHTLNVEIDELGNVVESATVAYGRLAADPSLPADVREAQRRTDVVYARHRYTDDVVDASDHRLRMVCETRTFELTGATPAARCFSREELAAAFNTAVDLEYHQVPAGGASERRLLQHQRTLYGDADDPATVLPLGVHGARGFVHETLALAHTPGGVASLYGTRVTPSMLAEGHFIPSAQYKASGRFPASDPDGRWWASSGTLGYPANPEQHFYLPVRYIDAAGTSSTVRYHQTHHLLVDRIEDALGNRTTVEAFDFRFLLPTRSRDLNDNLTEVRYDVFGFVAGVAVFGKGNEADDFVGFVDDATDTQIRDFLSDPAAKGPALLGNSTSRFVYDLAASPPVAASISRETHHAEALASGVASKLQYAFEYSDGGGGELMKKIQAEPGLAKRCTVHTDGSYVITDVDTTPERRWVGSGRVIRNNKGNAVLQFDPYFSATPAFESAAELVESGVSPLLRYDAAGRLVRTDYPDGTHARVEFDNWSSSTYDQNDTVMASDWYLARIGGGRGPAEQSAAQKTALHDGTPSVAHFDPHGRAHYVVAHNRFVDRGTGTVVEEFPATHTVHDIEGHPLAVIDARGNTVMRHAYDLLGQEALSAGMDSGERRAFHDALGKALYGWNAKGDQFHSVYDILHRPARHEVLSPGQALRVTERVEYGTNAALNQKGQMALRRDTAGTIAFDAYDFAGNLLQSTRALAASTSGEIDWTLPGAVAMDPRPPFTSHMRYDAFKRVVEATAPDNSRTRNTYNESNLLDTVQVGVGGGPLQSFVERIDHDARGQRLRIDYGNGTRTTFAYDPLTRRLQRTLTIRLSDGLKLQDLRNTYDPVGNITAIEDAAQQSAIFNNAVVAPGGSYTYDAIYRLVAATGRELVALNTPPTPLDPLRGHRPLATDDGPLQTYLQQYDYDVAGNMRRMVHSAGSGAFSHRWTRELTPEATTNRLATSAIGSATETYPHDVHGNLTSMPHLVSLAWNVDDHLVGVEIGAGTSAAYRYDADGQRIRKIVQRPGGIVEERVYLGALEIFRRIVNGVVVLERNSLHVLDSGRRIAIVDTLVSGNDNAVASLIRYQYSNHIGSAALELDDLAAIISYEEYYPFGSTSYQAVDGAREVPNKRYRYTGKERDEETGLYYHGARYYAPWLARWTAADPIGIRDGNNRYVYAGNSPIGISDPTGLWGWRTFVVVAAVVVVGAVVTVATAGVAGPVIAGAAATAFGAGTATATVATGIAVGAVAGAAGGLASGLVGEGTRQAVNSRALGLGREEFSVRAIARSGTEGLIAGAVGGAVTGGLGAAATVLRGGAAAAQAAGASSRAVSAAGRVARVARTTAGGAATGALGAATGDAAAQAVTRGSVDWRHVARSALTGAVVGGALSAGGQVRGLNTLGAKTVGRLNLAGKDYGMRIASRVFAEGSVGLSEARSFAAVGRQLNVGGEPGDTPANVRPRQAIVNPGREAMPLERLRAELPRHVVMDASAESIPMPAESVPSIVGRRLPNSIDWNQAAGEFNRVLMPGGTVDIATYGPGGLPDALRGAGFTNVQTQYGVHVTATKPVL